MVKERLLGGLLYYAPANANATSLKISAIQLDTRARRVDKRVYEFANKKNKRQPKKKRASKSVPASKMTLFGETSELYKGTHHQQQQQVEPIDDLLPEPVSFTSTSFSDVRKIVNKFDLNAHTRTITSGTTPIRQANSNPYSSSFATTTTTSSKIGSFVKTLLVSPRFVYEEGGGSFNANVMSFSREATPLTTPVLEKAANLLSSSSSEQVVNFLKNESEASSEDEDFVYSAIERDKRLSADEELVKTVIDEMIIKIENANL